MSPSTPDTSSPTPEHLSRWKKGLIGIGVVALFSTCVLTDSAINDQFTQNGHANIFTYDDPNTHKHFELNLYPQFPFIGTVDETRVMKSP